MPELQPYVDRIWLFESSYDMHVEDLRMVVPSGNVNLIYTLKGDYQTVCQSGLVHTTRENEFTFIGQQSYALRLLGSEPVTSLGVRFSPTGAYRFFGNQLFDTKRLVLNFEDIKGRECKNLMEKMLEAPTNLEKVNIFQTFLFKELKEPKTQESTVKMITRDIISCNGLISLDDLCAQTGWSKRHLNRVFSEVVGQNIKSWLQTIRFRHLYKLMQTDSKIGDEVIKDYYLLFYDQSHFINSFKKVTGKTPNQIRKSVNCFGNNFNRL